MRASQKDLLSVQKSKEIEGWLALVDVQDNADSMAAASSQELAEVFPLVFGVDVYIPHRIYQVKPHSSPRFSSACAATVVQKNYFFRLYQQNKSFKSKVKFRQASNCCKRGLEAAKLAYATKTKESITSQKLGC